MVSTSKKAPKPEEKGYAGIVISRSYSPSHLNSPHWLEH